MMFMFEPTDQMRRDFEAFLTHEFNDLSRPNFKDADELERALKVWWWVEVHRRQAQGKIAEFRRAFSSLTGIG